MAGRKLEVLGTGGAPKMFRQRSSSNRTNVLMCSRERERIDLDRPAPPRGAGARGSSTCTKPKNAPKNPKKILVTIPLTVYRIGECKD